MSQVCEKIKFSVIVPIYKVEDFLVRCIDSVVCQGYDNFELILVDDGSPDSCPAICERYANKDSRIKAIHKENGGLVSARKAGAQLATGDYVICLDGDDMLPSDCLCTYEEIITCYHPDMIYAGHTKVYEDHCEDYLLPYRKGLYTKDDIDTDIFPRLIHSATAEYFAPSVWAKAFRREVYVPSQLEVDERIKIGEDFACTVPCVLKSQLIYITDSVLYCYRQNQQSMTKVKQPYQLNWPQIVYEYLKRVTFGQEYNFDDQINRNAVHEIFVTASTQFLRKGTYVSSVCIIKQYLSSKFCLNVCACSKFKIGTPAWFMGMAVKRRLCFLLKLYCCFYFWC